jgi:geranylgeranyl reductase family protein
VAADRFDVLVVGGGPAGSSAALTAARAGLKVCLVDKKKFPREKLCGGLLTERSRTVFEQVFGRELPRDIVRSSDRIAFLAGARFLTGINGYSSFHATMRKMFDAHLLRLAESAGATVMQGDGVQSVQLDDNSVTLATGAALKYGVLIGADGVSSLVARSIFGEPFDQRTIGFGLEVEVPRALMPALSEVIEIDFSAARWGYGWVFPKPASFTIGVAGVHRLNPDLRGSLASYLALKGLNIREHTVKGQYIPFGDYRKTPGRANVVLAGDAAQVVDPITGEGIAYAMQTGSAAARAAAAALRTGDASQTLAMYARDYGGVASDLAAANRWRHLIFPRVIHPLFTWAFADAGTLQRGYLDIMAGRNEYQDLPGLFSLQLRRALRGLVRGRPRRKELST